ncbi:MAG TPA: terminase small subunit [Clostridia bacterium]|nr:terminase small subunit [Clostridia bacterium]
MTDKRERFIKEYLIDLNGTQAAIRAGYSPKTANEQASRLLANVSVRARIDAELAERAKRTGINADRVVRELARVAFVNPPDVIDINNATVKKGADENDTAAIASVKVKRISQGDFKSTEREIRFADKLRALELLGKHLGMFTENVRISGDMGVEIVNDIPKSAEDSD